MSKATRSGPSTSPAQRLDRVTAPTESGILPHPPSTPHSTATFSRGAEEGQRTCRLLGTRPVEGPRYPGSLHLLVCRSQSSELCIFSCSTPHTPRSSRRGLTHGRDDLAEVGMKGSSRRSPLREPGVICHRAHGALPGLTRPRPSPAPPPVARPRPGRPLSPQSRPWRPAPPLPPHPGGDLKPLPLPHLSPTALGPAPDHAGQPLARCLWVPFPPEDPPRWAKAHPPAAGLIPGLLGNVVLGEGAVAECWGSCTSRLGKCMSCSQPLFSHVEKK